MCVGHRSILLAAALSACAVNVLATEAPEPDRRPGASETGSLLGLSRARLPDWRVPEARAELLSSAGIERAVKDAALAVGAQEQRESPNEAPRHRSCGKRVLTGAIIGGLSGAMLGAVAVAAEGPGFDGSFIGPGAAALVVGLFGAGVGAGIGALTCLG
jgi:hypothetical protein